MKIDRLPVKLIPGFDCREDNAACPSCNQLRADGKNPADHGRSGGLAYYGVGGELADGRRVALVLEVFRCDYPTSIDRQTIPSFLLYCRAGGLSLHLERRGPPTDEHASSVESCDQWLAGKPCSADVGYLRGEQLWLAVGNDDPDLVEQDDAFWLALTMTLEEMVRTIAVIN